MHPLLNKTLLIDSAKKILFVFMLHPMILSAQQVTTIVDDPSTRFRNDLIFDAAGNLYCTDYGGNSVYKRTPDGIVTTFATGFNAPNGMAFDSQYNLFVADNLGNRIYKLSSGGQFLDTFEITGPAGLIKMPDSDTLLFTDYPGNSLSKLAPDGTVIPLYTGTPINGAFGMTWSPDQRLYLTNFGTSEVYEFIFGASITVDSVTSLSPPSQGGSWLGFLEYSNGFIWATAYDVNRIYTINPTSSQVTWVAGSIQGSIDGDADNAQFNTPNGIVASVTGDTLYVSDYGTGRLRMITDVLLGLESQESSVLTVYPNPANLSFSISFSEEISPDQVELLDLAGRKLKTWGKAEIGGSFSTQGITPGSYVLKISFENKVIEKSLFVQ
jgi:sugar lactone lactonase YvrE